TALIANRSELSVNLAAPSAARDYGIQLVFRCRAHRQLGSVIEHNAKLFDIVNGLAGQQRMSAAGIVPDHSAESASAVSGRIRAKGQMVSLGAFAQTVQNESGLNARKFALRIGLQNTVHIFGEIQHNVDGT